MAEKEYIERDKLIGDGWHLQRHVYGNGYACIESMDIRDIPAADVRPVKHGKWTDAIVSANNFYDRLGMIASMHGYVCSCCQDFSVARYNFCPNCGADMREEK